MLPGITPLGGRGYAGPVLTYVTSVHSAVSATSHTFTNVPIGSGDYLIAVWAGRGAGFPSISSRSITGCTLSIVKNSLVIGSSTLIDISPHPGTATATVSITRSSTIDSDTVSIYTMSGALSSTAVFTVADNESAGGTVSSGTINLSGDCCWVAVGSAGGANTWNDGNLDYSVNTVGAYTSYVSEQRLGGFNAEEVTFDGVTGSHLVMAAWQ